MSKNKELNIFEAAVLLSISPELLRWLTKYGAKSDGKKKLKVLRKAGDMLFFDQDELVTFSNWLAEPWPTKKNTRPIIPAGILTEIKTEAAGQCAICHSHKDSCEAAHIEPVSQSKNNHPHNLLWLCANHHTKYDKGTLGPMSGQEEFVKGLKIVLLSMSKILYESKAEGAKIIFHIIETCRRAALLNPTTPEQIASVATLAEDSLDKLIGVKNNKKQSSKDFTAFKKLGELASSKSFEKTRPIKERLELVATLREDFREAAGMCDCPLCKGTGIRNGDDCFLCHGDGVVSNNAAASFDARDFDLVNCPLCEGVGIRHDDDCPVCRGDKHIERRFADFMDLGDYSTVDCPLCEGSGGYEQHDCPECHGDGSMDRRFAELIDLKDYTDVNCPLCNGSGQRDDHDCEVCQGDKVIPRKEAERVDVSAYEMVYCPLCDGEGRYDGDDCPYCGGEQQVASSYAEAFDKRDFDMVECPLCDGKGTNEDNDCGACDGSGEVTRKAAEQLHD
ncbi:Hypothetical protein mma_1030 [Janthinobacterium sp. Marseille]|uniref:Zinc finger domain-containing protein n=1 Tax=Herminiimonas aquatilis TaxID=345342 RepID=A0ABW2J9Z5_9BURK|nr:HNH endonuclease signature motif containing protein [Janthinobacterium sp. Marseille]ABR91928.1 Hypothetical protein mma_1030 [Janthinobacterium sp. Marseille]